MKGFLLPQHLFALFLLAGLLISGTSYSQVFRAWAQFYNGFPYGGGRQIHIATGDSGNVYLTGVVKASTDVSIFNVSDYVTIKYNSLGMEQWVVRYDGFYGHDEPMAIAVDRSGNVYVTGTSVGDETGYDFATIKYNSAGVQQWVARFNSYGSSLDYVSGIQVDKDGNVYLTGSSAINNYHWDYTTVKYNHLGVQQWVRYYNGAANEDDMARAIVLDPVTSDVYITGSTANLNTGGDMTTVKYNSAGTEQWVRNYNSFGDMRDAPAAISLDATGNVYVTGMSGASYLFSSCVTIKYDRSGNVQWITPYTGSGNSVTWSTGIAVDPSGTVYITGLTGQSDSSCLTIKYNADGVEQWVRLYHGPGNTNFARGDAISLDNEGNVYIAGVFGPDHNSDVNFFAIRYDADGTEKWVRIYDDLPSYDAFTTIAVDKYNNVYLAGFVRINTDETTYHFEYCTIKYVQPKPLIVAASPNTAVYYGYGSNCIQLKADVTGGIPPYTFSWWPGGSTPNNKTTTVCPTTSSVFTIVVEDALGTTDTAQLTVNVTDVRCGNQNDKVLICHNGNELCIAPSAVAAHLKHGDKLGSCFGGSNDCEKLKDLNSYKERFPFIFKAFPNPFNCISTIIYQLPLDAQVTIALLDPNGREIAILVKEKKRAGYYVAFINAGKLTAGTYLCRMVISAPPCQWVHTLKLAVMK